ncbi:MAG: M16 family metallopeptidase [bacterium]
MKRTIIFLTFFLLILLREGSAETSDHSPATVSHLDNGMEVVLIENHSNPMVASIVVVKTGSVNETIEMSGASHMLEHLLFNGTKKRTQKELYDETDFYGIYNNATTGRSHTDYMVLTAAQYIEQALDIQSDMLFNSTIPPEKLQKERGIVIEEIGKDRDRVSTLAEQFFNRKMYAGTPYELPVIGNPKTIEWMTREQILDYYQTYYVPNNMTALIMGDFNTAEMLKKVERYFGGYAPKSLPGREKVELAAIQKNQIYSRRTITNRIYLTIGLHAPAIKDDDFYTFYVLTAMLESENSDLQKELKQQLSAFTVSPEYAYDQDLGVFKINLTLPESSDVDKAIEAVVQQLKSVAQNEDMAEELRKTKLKIKVDEIFLQDNLLYFLMFKASAVASADYRFVHTFLGEIDQLDQAGIEQVVQRYFDGAKYLATVVKPEMKKEKTAEKVAQSVVIKEVLDNGLTVIIKENQDSRAFALHLLAKNRALNEPEDKAGIADFMHRMLRKDETVSSAFEEIGARIKVTDSPYIPFDDYYTTPRYSYIRLEIIDQYIQAGLDVFADMIRQPKFEEKNIEKVRGTMIDLIKRQQESTKETARRLFYQHLFGDGNPLSQRAIGTKEGIDSIVKEDLEAFHQTYFAPNNLILAIVSNVPAYEMLAQIKAYFGRLNASTDLKNPSYPFSLVKGQQIFSEKKGKQQSYIYCGTLFEVAAEDRIPLAIMNRLLSDRLGFNLREKKGLAYSIGSSVNFQGNYGWLVATMGTRPERLDEAQAGIIEEMNKLKQEQLTEKEVQKTVNALVGRILMRRLPRVNQAYFMGLFEFDGLGYDYYEPYLENLKAVTLADVQRVIGKYLQTKDYVMMVVE